MFVSHNLDTIDRLCTQSAWLEHGRVAELGPTQTVVDAYTKTSRPAPTGGESELPPDVARQGTGEVHLTKVRHARPP